MSTSNPAPGGAIVVRDAVDADLPAIQAIYAHHVLTGIATFEEIPPTVADMARRRQAVLEAGMPYLVAEQQGSVVGYAYAGPYRPRSAYRFTIEDSVYLREGSQRQGIGRSLLGALIAACEKGPWRQMIAVIGDSANAGSIALHRSFGFRDAGIQQAVGLKFGRWVDTVQMQRSLGDGDATLPAR